MSGGGWGGLTNKRPQTDYVIRGPMRGLEQNHMGRGHQTDTQTLQLLDRIGPVGQFGENKVASAGGGYFEQQGSLIAQHNLAICVSRSTCWALSTNLPSLWFHQDQKST